MESSSVPVHLSGFISSLILSQVFVFFRSQGDRDSRPGCSQPAEERPSSSCVWHFQRLRGWIVLPCRPQGEGEGEERTGALREGEAAAAEIYVSIKGTMHPIHCSFFWPSKAGVFLNLAKNNRQCFPALTGKGSQEHFVNERCAQHRCRMTCN